MHASTLITNGDIYSGLSPQTYWMSYNIIQVGYMFTTPTNGECKNVDIMWSPEMIFLNMI